MKLLRQDKFCCQEINFIVNDYKIICYMLCLLISIILEVYYGIV